MGFGCGQGTRNVYIGAHTQNTVYFCVCVCMYKNKIDIYMVDKDNFNELKYAKLASI